MKPYGTSLSSVCTWDPACRERAGVGDYLTTEAGSWYLIVEAIQTRNPAKVRYTLIRTDPAEVDPEATVYRFRWNSRSRRRPG